MPIYDGQGRLVAVQGIARDITERHKAEQPLRLKRGPASRASTRCHRATHTIPACLLEFSLVKAIELTGSDFGYVYFGTADGDTVLRTRERDAEENGGASLP